MQYNLYKNIFCWFETQFRLDVNRKVLYFNNLYV